MRKPSDLGHLQRKARPLQFRRKSSQLLGLMLLSLALAWSGRAAGAETDYPAQDLYRPPFTHQSNQSAPSPASQRVKYLGQTGGLITDFAMKDDLIFAPEGDALTVLQLDPEGKATVIARVSPNQGRIQGIALSGETVFLITPIGLAAVDVSDPQHPEVISFLPGGGEAVKAAGEFVFVAARAAGLRIINISNPHRPVLAGTLDIPGKALAIALNSRTNLAYVAADEGGLRIIDIAAPDLPHEVGSIELPDGVQQIELQEALLFLSSGDRIYIMDIQEPGTPARLGIYAPPRQARRAKIDGSYIYVADLDGGLEIFDVSNMARPLLVYSETDGSAYDILVQGNRAYVADGREGIRILNISNPRAPQLVAQLALEGMAQGLAIWEDALLVAAGQAGFYLVHIGNERAPTVLGQLDTEGDARDVQAGESLAYVADGPNGLVIISLLDPRSPQLRGSIYTPGEAQALAVNGTFVYVAANDGGLQIFDAIRPAAPFLVGALTLPDGQQAVDIALVNKRAYLAIQGETAAESGLAIADVGFRDRPVILARVQGPASGVAVRGVEPITVGGTDLMTVDARASSGPVLLGRYRPPQGAGGMDWADGTLYLTSSGTGSELTLLDVSNPGRPVERLHFGLTSEGGTVMARNGRVYMATGRRGLRSLITSNPVNPLETVIYDPMDTLTRLVTLPGEITRVYEAGEEGWAITSIQNPALPQPLARVQTDTPVYRLARDGDRLYVVSTTSGLLIYDAPLGEAGNQEPIQIGQWSKSTLPRDLLVRNGYIYLLDRLAGLMVIDPNPPDNPTLLQTLALSGNSEQIVPLTYDLAYIRTSDESDHLRLVDLGHPTLGMIPQGQFQTDASTVQVAWPFAFTLDGSTFTSWLIAVDEKNPGGTESPMGSAEPQASFRINGTLLFLAGDQAFVGSDAGHVSVVDLTDPVSPRVLGMMGNGAAARGMALYGNLLAIGLETIPSPEEPIDAPTRGQVRIWDISAPQDPQEAGLIEFPYPITAMGQQTFPDRSAPQVVVAGVSLAVLEWQPYARAQGQAAAAQGMTLTLVADLSLPAAATSLVLDGDMAYLGTESSLVIVNGLASNAPAILSELPLGHAVKSVAVYEERGYLAAQDVGGLIVDLSDPGNPRSIANLPSPSGGPPQSLTLVGQQLWAIWDGWIGWLEVGQAQPGPSEIDRFSLGGTRLTDMAVEGSRAYLTGAESGLLVLDISDPADPMLLGSLDTPGQAHALTLAKEGTIGYIADGDCGVRVVATNPETGEAPNEIGFWHTGYALDVAIQGNNIYVADIGEMVALEFDPAGEILYPAVPQSPQPANGAMFYQEEVTLSWGPAAASCDPLTYDLYLGITQPIALLASDLHSATFRVQELQRRQTYLWQVVARDRQGDQTSGPLWQFEVRTNAQPPPVPTRAAAAELPSPQQEDVIPLIGGLTVAGILAAALWGMRAVREVTRSRRRE